MEGRGGGDRKSYLIIRLVPSTRCGHLYSPTGTNGTQRVKGARLEAWEAPAQPLNSAVSCATIFGVRRPPNSSPPLPGEPDRGDAQHDHTTNLSGGNPGCFRMANCGMNGSFRLGGCGDSDFDEPPNPVIERPGAVTLVFQFLKCLPYACGKAAPSATMASILIHTIVSIRSEQHDAVNLGPEVPLRWTFDLVFYFAEPMVREDVLSSPTSATMAGLRVRWACKQVESRASEFQPQLKRDHAWRAITTQTNAE